MSNQLIVQHPPFEKLYVAFHIKGDINKTSDLKNVVKKMSFFS